MDETIDYLAERYPDLSDGDLQDLYSVGMRFCQPAIPHGRKRYGFAAKEPGLTAEATVDLVEAPGELIPEEGPGENTAQES
jgi:hypothetical protein